MKRSGFVNKDEGKENLGVNIRHGTGKPRSGYGNIHRSGVNRARGGARGACS